MRIIKSMNSHRSSENKNTGALILADEIQSGNSLTILKNGDEVFPAMLKAIRSAQESVELCTYVYWRGQVAHDIADALSERASSGVEVRLLIDAIGSFKIEKELLDRLEASGVKVARFRPAEWFGLHKLNRRTHTRFWLSMARSVSQAVWA